MLKRVAIVAVVLTAFAILLACCGGSSGTGASPTTGSVTVTGASA